MIDSSDQYAIYKYIDISVKEKFYYKEFFGIFCKISAIVSMGSLWLQVLSRCSAYMHIFLTYVSLQLLLDYISLRSISITSEETEKSTNQLYNYDKNIFKWLIYLEFIKLHKISTFTWLHNGCVFLRSNNIIKLIKILILS